MRVSLVTLCVILSAAPAVRSADADLAKRAEEVKDLRFGARIVWSFGTFSDKAETPGVKDLALFHPSGCDTDQWAAVAKEAGMGYLLFVAKRCDGLCMWDTETTDRKVTNSPLGKDVLAAVRKSCNRYGIKLALSYSQGDWTWPGAVDGGANWPGAKKGTRPHGLIAGVDQAGGINPEVEKAQLTELLTQYGPIEFFWFDSATGDGGLDQKATADFVKSLQPRCLSGFNHGQPAGEMRLGEMGFPSSLDDPRGAPIAAKQKETWEYKDYLVAEFCFPIQSGRRSPARWLYSGPQNEDKVMPAEEIVKFYRDAVKVGNIFSLAVGPDRAGRLRDIDVKMLREVGGIIRTSATLR